MNIYSSCKHKKGGGLIKERLVIAMISLLIVALQLHGNADSGVIASYCDPTFMTRDQIVKWKTEVKTHSFTKAGPAAENYFFTGKVFLPEACAYDFKYRTYNPYIGRWTSTDPEGFRDGANNSSYGGAPTLGFDRDGLAFVALRACEFDYQLSDRLPFTIGIDLGDETGGASPSFQQIQLPALIQ